MRKLIIATGVLALATPAPAQPPQADPRDEEIVRSLPQREEIERLGDTMERVTDAIMDIDIGPIVDAAEGRRHSRRHRETLGDIASRDDPYGRERVREQVGMATVGLGAVVEQLAVLTPVLRRSLEDATRRMEDAMHRGREEASREWERNRRHRDDDRDRDRRDDDPR
ncbi:MAG TPA: hypothetical protein VGB59_08790 [Allosphingosinicella sp.]